MSDIWGENFLELHLKVDVSTRRDNHVTSYQSTLDHSSKLFWRYSRNNRMEP
jgi:hypothetical protein